MKRRKVKDKKNGGRRVNGGRRREGREGSASSKLDASPSDSPTGRVGELLVLGWLSFLRATDETVKLIFEGLKVKIFASETRSLNVLLSTSLIRRLASPLHLPPSPFPSLLLLSFLLPLQWLPTLSLT